MIDLMMMQKCTCNTNVQHFFILILVRLPNPENGVWWTRFWSAAQILLFFISRYQTSHSMILYRSFKIGTHTSLEFGPMSPKVKILCYILRNIHGIFLQLRQMWKRSRLTSEVFYCFGVSWKACFYSNKLTRSIL